MRRDSFKAKIGQSVTLLTLYAVGVIVSVQFNPSPNPTAAYVIRGTKFEYESWWWKGGGEVRSRVEDDDVYVPRISLTHYVMIFTSWFGRCGFVLPLDSSIVAK